jgi:P4 family phage/plasmid primase-like protien
LKLSAPKHINSAAPFSNAAKEYLSKGWNVIPLPERKKKSPPDDVTGRAGRLTTLEDIEAWSKDPKWAKGNIAVRPGNVIEIDGKPYEALGIDVDAYGRKAGDKQLLQLEKLLGPLPGTWISSARSDGKSGIRWFLVPHGFSYMGKPRIDGKATDSIEIIQRVHRYGLVFPSWHPDTKGQYWWYERGQSPDGVHLSPRIPNIRELAALPNSWLKHLTRDCTEEVPGVPMDMDSEPTELADWLVANLVDGEVICETLQKALDNHLDVIANGNDHHDPLVNAHWNLLLLGAEGHTGWNSARTVVESAWMDRAVGDGSRRLTEAKFELLRSRIGSQRKLKGTVDFAKETGLAYLVDMDPCDGGPKPPNRPPPKALHAFYKGVDPVEFDKNDVGQANHFIARVLDNVHHLSDYNAWIIYDGTTWHIDSDQSIKDRFITACVLTSKRRSKGLKKQRQRLVDAGVTLTDARIVKITADIKRLDWVGEHYGNDPKIISALNVTKSIPGVSMQFNEMNWDTTVLAMPAGRILRLDKPSNKPQPEAKGFTIAENDKSLFTTLATGVDYVFNRDVPDTEKRLWRGYLDLFLPPEPSLNAKGEETQDFSYRRFVQKALGYIMFGGNPNKLGIFLVGKRDSGKTTMIKALQAALGGYANTFQPNSVFKDGGANNPELGNLLHCRGIFSSEAGSQRIHANPFKRNTGGDKISVTRKYANDQIVGVPQFVPVVATNQAPTIDDADEALIKRIMVLPFDLTVDEQHNDRHMDTVIETQCKHAVLSWLCAGYRAYIREGLDWNTWHPNAQSATRQFAVELNDVSSFVSEHCIIAEGEAMEQLGRQPGSTKAVDFQNSWMQVTTAALYALYTSEFAGDPRLLTSRMFIKKIKQLYGVERFYDRAGTMAQQGRFKGLKWKNERRAKAMSD